MAAQKKTGANVMQPAMVSNWYKPLRVICLLLTNLHQESIEAKGVLVEHNAPYVANDFTNTA